MYNELKKYKTGKKVKEKIILYNGQEIKIFSDECVIPLGDLIRDYINHKKKPIWKRNFYHKALEETYIGLLNEIKFTYDFF